MRLKQTMRGAAFGAVLAVAAAQSAMAAPITWTFGSGGGKHNLGAEETFVSDGESLLAAAFKGGAAWHTASLSQTGKAIGVISGWQGKGSTLAGWGFSELIRLTLPTGFAAISVELDALGKSDEFAIWGSSNGTSLDGLLSTGVGGKGVDLIALPDNDYRHLIFGIPQGEWASYRVQSLTAEAVPAALVAGDPSAIDEPYAFVLLASGLLGLYLLRQRVPNVRTPGRRRFSRP
ncbi:MAG: hypothetical protein MI806_17265 [Minwuiales bacterium]|nr:hypothetical protein [Minwuiales bacterium]